MLKRLLCILLTAIMLLSAFTTTEAKAANESVRTRLFELVKQFPHGKYWNHMGSKTDNPDGVTSKPCSGHISCSWKKNCSCNKFDNAIQCMGYAYKIAYEIVGVSARDFTKSYTLDASKLRVGDVIRYKNNTHSITVTGINGKRISFTDCNWTGKCQIRWAQMNLSSIKGFSYVLHYKNNNRKNADLDFYEDTEQPDNTELWLNSPTSSLNVRKDHSVDSEYITTIPSGKNFYIYRHYSDGTYLWGRVKYGAYKGWCVLNWAEYISTNGTCAQPSFISPQKEYSKHDATFRWSETAGANRYTFRIYDSDGNFIKKYTTKTQKCTIDIKKAGTYKAKVYARSTLSESWLPVSKTITFVLNLHEPVYVSEISLPEIVTVVCGANKTIKATVLPENACDKTLLWSSNNEYVATVNSKGVIKTKACGSTEIICTADDKGEVRAKCLVVVKPAKVKKLKMTDKTEDDKVPLSWNAVKGATYYSIYMERNGSFSKIGETTELSYQITGLKPNKDYYFKVRAVYKKGRTLLLGTHSDKIKATA